MNNTINGRTPEEIKRGLECCSPRYESKHWVSCSSECPFRDEGVYCRNVLNACSKKYIQQLERERDAAVEAMFLKPLSWDEAMGDDAFLEIKDDECIDAALNLFACCTCDGSVKDGFVYYETHNANELKLLEIDYGKTWRCWARRPTDEERAAAAWEVE